LKKLFSIFNLLRKGYVVANPTAWKKGQITVNVLATVLVAGVGVAKAFGMDIHLTEEEALTLAGAVLIIVGLFDTTVTVVSSEKVGLLPERTDEAQSKPTNGLTGRPY
jgi:hypothetical protein